MQLKQKMMHKIFQWIHLNEICQKVDIPVVAIGGINQVNILEFMGVAIDGVAIVSSIFGSDDIQKQVAY